MPDEVVNVERVEARKTQSGDTRFVLVDDSGREFTTFKEPIARQALAAEGRRAKITFHEPDGPLGGYPSQGRRRRDSVATASRGGARTPPARG